MWWRAQQPGLCTRCNAVYLAGEPTRPAIGGYLAQACCGPLAGPVTR